MRAHAAIQKLRGSWAAFKEQHAPLGAFSFNLQVAIGEQAAIGGASCDWRSRFPLAETRRDYSHSLKQPTHVIMVLPEP